MVKHVYAEVVRWFGEVQAELLGLQVKLSLLVK